jgi:hypothetical protein
MRNVVQCVLRVAYVVPHHLGVLSVAVLHRSQRLERQFN